MIEIKVHKQVAHGHKLRTDSFQQTWRSQCSDLDGCKANPRGARCSVDGGRKDVAVAIAQRLVFIGVCAGDDRVVRLRAAASRSFLNDVILCSIIEYGADAVGVQALDGGLDGIAILACWEMFLTDMYVKLEV